MNPTLKRFGYPELLIREYAHWVVLIRPCQVTLGCTVIAAKSDCISLGALGPEEGAELPLVMQEFESAVRRIAPAVKFNYLALMMVDPNPHFHAIPRYAADVHFSGTVFADVAFPGPPDVRSGHTLTVNQLQGVRLLLMNAWPN